MPEKAKEGISVKKVNAVYELEGVMALKPDLFTQAKLSPLLWPNESVHLYQVVLYWCGFILCSLVKKGGYCLELILLCPN